MEGGAKKPEALGSHPRNSGEGARGEFKGWELFGQMEKGENSAPKPEEGQKECWELRPGGRRARGVFTAGKRDRHVIGEQVPCRRWGRGQRRGEIGGVAETKTRSQAISHAKQRTLDLGLLTQNKIEKLKHIKEGGFFPARELGKASWRRCRLRWTGQRKRRTG